MTTQAEQNLLNSLSELENASNVRKGGDALQNAPHDGGFASEGTNIQNLKKMKKALMKGGMSAAEADEMLKAFPPAKGADAESEADDDASGDNDSASPDGDDASSEEPVEKSVRSAGASQLANASSRTKDNALRKALVDENPKAGDAIDAAPVLGQLVDQLAKSNSISKKGADLLRKSLHEMDVRTTTFNTKIAKALVAVMGSLNELSDKVQSISDQPVHGSRPTLRKSDIHEPEFHGGGTGGFDGSGEPSPLMSIEPLKIQEALVQMVMKGGADIMDVTKFENAKCNINVLPVNIRKALENQLCPTA